MSNSISSLYKIKRIEELFCAIGSNIFLTDDLFTAAERKIATLIPPLDIPLLLSISARVNEVIFYVWGKAKEIKVALLDIRKGT